MKGFFSGGEVGDVLQRIQSFSRLIVLLSVLFLLLLLLDSVGLNLRPAGTSKVQLNLGQERPLDVGDGGWLISFNKEVLNNSALHVNQEGLLKEGLQVAGDLSLLNSLLIFIIFVQATPLGEVDFTIDSDKAGFFKLNAEAVVGEGLDSDLGGESETGILVVADVGNTGEDL